MVTACVALGSNLGDRQGYLEGARAALAATPGVAVTAASSLYETEPVGGPALQGPYLNAVLALRTTLSSRELLAQCLGIEARFGRTRGQTWGARTLDLDLLFYADELREEADLVLPHPRLHLRRFVLAPLADVAPDWVHPRLGRSVGELLETLSSRDGVRRLAHHW